jgi:hypothetical protein
MAQLPERNSLSVRRTLAIAIVVAALVGAGTGYLAGSLATPSRTAPTPQTREFWVFTVVLPFNDSTPGFPSHDYFAPDRMTVNKGDTVTIHFFNTEAAPENHTFTMDAPYAMNHVLPYGQTTTFSFVANTPGIFPYRCVYHQPTMTGWLVVLG